MAMRAAQRSASGLCTFSRLLARSFSGYGASIRYAAAQNAVSVEDPEGVDAEESANPSRRSVSRDAKDLIQFLQAAGKAGTPVNEALKGYQGKYSVGILEKAVVRLQPQNAYPLYMWAKSRAGLEYNRVLVLGLLSAFRKCKQLEAAEALVSEITGKVDESLECAARSMLYLAYVVENQTEKAEQLKAQMLEKGFQLDSGASTHLLHTRFEEQGLDAMIELYKEHCATGFAPDKRGYYRLVLNLCRADRLDEALQIFDEGVQRGVQHLENTRLVLIQELVKQNKVEEALNVAKEITELKQNSTAHPLNALITQLATKNQCDAAMDLVKLLLPRHNPIVAGLVKQLLDVGEWEKLSELVKLLAEHNVKAVANYDRMITALCKEKRLDDARRAFDLMIACGHSPNPKSCSDLAELAKAEGA